MNTTFKIFTLFYFLFFVSSISLFGSEEEEKYLGRWALNFEEGMGWLEVRQQDGYLDADLLWRSGSVLPVANVYVSGGKLHVTRTSRITFDNPDGNVRTHTVTSNLVLEGRGNQLIGTFTIPQRDGIGANIFYVHADKIPPVPAAPDLSKLEYGKSVDLLKDGMKDWRLLEPNATNGWSFEKGELKNNPVQKEGEPHIHYGNLRTNAQFEDFNLKVSVNIPKGSNSGIYLRGVYEVQVVDSYGKKQDSHNMGALYSRIRPSVTAEKKPGKWQKMDITLCHRHLTVILNGKKIIDNQPVEGVTGGAMTSDEFVPGPIYLQGDHGAVRYKDMVLTPILN